MTLGKVILHNIIILFSLKNNYCNLFLRKTCYFFRLIIIVVFDNFTQVNKNSQQKELE